jgi:hypothetical protein
MKYFTSLFFILFLGLTVKSQPTEFELVQQQWESILDATNPKEKLSRNEAFAKYIASTPFKLEITEDKKFTKFYDLNTLDQFSEMWSKDSTLRIRSWYFALDDEYKQYNFHIDYFQNDSLVSFGLSSNSQINGSEAFYGKVCNKQDSIFFKEGYFFYDLITTEGKFETYYTLLGWSKDNLTSQKKIIQTFKLNNKENCLDFSPSILESAEGKATYQRIFEYGAQNTMKLKYIGEQEWILMDHLSPPTSQYEGVYEYYGPDLSFDAYVWNNNRWQLKKDVDADKGIKKNTSEFEVKDKVLKEEKIYSPK